MGEMDLKQLESEMTSGGVSAVLDRLVEGLREGEKYYELFEALKMRLRHRLGLPVLNQNLGDDLPEAERLRLEDGLIEACREVGMLLLGQGKIREAWMYLRPVGDTEVVAAELAKIPVDENNLEEYVEVALHEGVAPERGFQLVLEHYGTCNAITTFEAQMHSRPKPVQQSVAALLVRHLHEELLSSVKADVAKEEKTEPPENTLGQIVEGRPWLTADGRYHLDTTHLASTVRFARLIDDPEVLRLALDLTEYGRRLASELQFPGDEPFAELYPSHALYFGAMLGQQVEEALEFFRQRAQSVNIEEQGSAAAEIYVGLLARTERYPEAIEASIELLSPELQTLGYAPSLLELSELAGDYDRFMRLCEDRGDMLGFAAGLVQANLQKAG